MNVSYMYLSGDGTLGSLGLTILLCAGIYFFFLGPQRKQEKRDSAMRASLEVGDEVVTEGGIIGLVVSIREDTIVLETGSDRSKIRIARWAVKENRTPNK